MSRPKPSGEAQAFFVTFMALFLTVVICVVMNADSTDDGAPEEKGKTEKKEGDFLSPFPPNHPWNQIF